MADCIYDYKKQNTALGHNLYCLSVRKKNLTPRGRTAISGHVNKTEDKAHRYVGGPTPIVLLPVILNKSVCDS